MVIKENPHRPSKPYVWEKIKKFPFFVQLLKDKELAILPIFPICFDGSGLGAGG